MDISGGDVAAEERPVGFNEAEQAVHRYAAVDESAYDVDLSEHSASESGAVTGSDEQPLHPSSERGALDLEAAEVCNLTVIRT